MPAMVAVQTVASVGMAHIFTDEIPQLLELILIIHLQRNHHPVTHTLCFDAVVAISQVIVRRRSDVS